MKTSKVYLAVILLAAISLNGCAVISWTVAQFQRPKKVKALYNLPPDKRVLVLVDGCGDGSDEVVKRDLTEHLNFQLLKHKLVRETIRYNALLAYRLSTPNFHKVSSVEIGEKFKADLVIRVKIDRFMLKDNPDDVLWHGRFETSVKVILVSRPDEPVLWPDAPQKGHEVDSVVRDPVTNSSPSYGRKLARVLAVEMADRIAKLFYTHRLSGPDAWAGKATGETPDILQ